MCLHMYIYIYIYVYTHIHTCHVSLYVTTREAKAAAAKAGTPNNCYS